MSRLARACVLWALAASPVLAAGPADLDEERAAWRYRRSVTLPAAEARRGLAFAALTLAPEVGARSQPDLRDLRLVGPDGREIQYVLDRAVSRESAPRWTGRLVDVVREARRQSVWVVDLGEPRAFDSIALDVRQPDFAKRIRVEASDDSRAWRLVRQDAGIFDRPWSFRVHHTTITLPERLVARYLRLTADDTRSRPVEVYGVVASASRRIPGEQWRRPVLLDPIPSGSRVSRYRLDLPPGLPFETFELDADDPAFSRRVVLYEAREANARREEVVLGDRPLYRLKIADEALSGEALTLPVRPPQRGELILEVHDGDSPPLRNIRGSVSSAATRLLFPAVAGTLTLYYGNDTTRTPLYDLESLKGRLGLNPAFANPALGPEEMNPRFRKASPLPFAAARGSPVEVPRWRAFRRVTIPDREDLYTVHLAPEDLALAEPELGDLRIVDEADRQVPYILEPGAAEMRLGLTVERQARTAGGDTRTLSRYRLAAFDRASGKPVSLPFSAVEVTFREDFFTRPARLLAPAPAGSRSGERSVFAGTLVRAAGPRGRPPSPGGPAGPAPIVFGLDGSRVSALFLEVDEGDNAPLTLLEAQGVVRVPRIAFKAAPGAYRLLIGNAQAQPPRYDIASLRKEILSYSAVVVEAGPTETNTAFRRGAGDYVKDVPPSLLLWGTLLGAVIVLLLLTVRILRTSRAQGSGERR